MNISLNIYFYLVILMIFISGNSHAASYKFVGTEFPYILSKDKNGGVNGIGAQLAIEIMSALGHKINIEIYPWKRALSMVKTGKAHVLIGPYKNSERESFLDYSAWHFYQDHMVLYSKRGSVAQWNGKLDDLKKLKLGLIAGWSYGDAFDQFKSKLSIYESNHVEQCFNMLRYHRIDVCLLNQRNANYYLESNGFENSYVQDEKPIADTKGYFGFSKKLELDALIRDFDSELERLVNENKVKNINGRYGLSYSKN